MKEVDSIKCWPQCLTIIALAAFSLQHLYSTNILLQLDLQNLILPAKPTKNEDIQNVKQNKCTLLLNYLRFFENLSKTNLSFCFL